ncbi:AraC family transcriptional regulator [Pseudomonas sp. D1-36]|uniref:AraC family transcriptional regulator n=1 Tax=Pseudomonas sp. D1-36 TaxID=2817387 RepID=UPI003DA9DFDA
MTHPSLSAVRTPLTPLQKSNHGGLSPWRESLVKKMIFDGLGETLAIARLAEACALSRSHFSRAFKASTGQSPQAWIRGQRIMRAKRLMQTTDLTLTQISQECGFCDQAHFCHIFTHSEGISPFAWRSRMLRTLLHAGEPG